MGLGNIPGMTRGFRTQGLALFLGLVMAMAGAVVSAQTPLASGTVLRPGDELLVEVVGFPELSGPAVVLEDGSVVGRGFGPIKVGGLSISAARLAIQRAVARTVRDPEVYLSVVKPRTRSVFVVGAPQSPGSIEWTPGLTLRQVLASVPLNENLDTTRVTLYRGNRPPMTMGLDDLLRGVNNARDVALEAGDVVAVMPQAVMRVWLTGEVAKPGNLALPEGADVYQALAAAGGLAPTAPAGTLDEGRLVLRRGDEVHEFPIRPDASQPRFRVEPGDTLALRGPDRVTVTVAGEVTQPGEVSLLKGRGAATAIAQAQGMTDDGTLKRVLIFRNGSATQLDLTKPQTEGTLSDVPLQSGDVIYVPRSERTLLVLGTVNRPGSYRMPDDRPWRLSDALAAAGGVNGAGTLRRVAVVRADATGKMVPTIYNLDEYLKDGILAANPVLEPGDSVLFGTPRGINLNTALSILPSLLVVDSLLRR